MKSAILKGSLVLVLASQKTLLGGSTCCFICNFYLHSKTSWYTSVLAMLQATNVGLRRPLYMANWNRIQKWTSSVRTLWYGCKQLLQIVIIVVWSKRSIKGSIGRDGAFGGVGRVEHWGVEHWKSSQCSTPLNAPLPLPMLPPLSMPGALKKWNIGMEDNEGSGRFCFDHGYSSVRKYLKYRHACALSALGRGSIGRLVKCLHLNSFFFFFSHHIYYGMEGEHCEGLEQLISIITSRHNLFIFF